ncbi:MAG: sulfite exporter TauE/SafE family protein [Ignavibacteriae bacterium]|nr:sulfite exporter TauE/SafE family protein [Ignavibacteriota bacterium]
MYEILITALIGAFIGTSSGMLGLGGALAATPLLKILVGLPPLLALASPLPSTLPSAISGAFVYRKLGLINYKLAKWVLVAALPMNIVGTQLTKDYFSPSILMYYTGAFILFVGSTFFIRGWLLKEAPEEEVRHSVGWALLTGTLTGLVSGILAIGGGIVMIPLFIKINKLRVKSAFATSLFTIAVLAIPGSIGHFLLGHIHIPTMIVLMIMVVPFSYLGASLAVRLRGKTLERIFGTFMLILAIYFILTQ